MLGPVALRSAGGRVFVGPLSMLPPHRRDGRPPAGAIERIFRDPAIVAQLRTAWPRLGLIGDHEQHLTPPELRRAIEGAVAAHRLAVLWIPPPSDRPILVPPGSGVAQPKPPPLPPSAGVPARPAMRSPVGALSPPEKVARAVDEALAGLAADARTSVAGLRRAVAALDREQIGRIAAFCARLAVPGVGDAAALAFLAYCHFRLGFDGARAALNVGAASFQAANARNDAEIDAAARLYAASFEQAGEAALAWLLARVQIAASGGARGKAGAAEADAAASLGPKGLSVPDPAKIVKEAAGSYSSQLIAKYKESVGKVVPPAIAEAALAKLESSFSAAEMAVIDEVRAIVASPELAQLAAAHAAGEPLVATIAGRLIQYEPDLRAAGMTMFGENGFLLGVEAFVSALERNKTLLHELYRLAFSDSAEGVTAELIARETKAAFDFAEKAARLIP